MRAFFNKYKWEFGLYLCFFIIYFIFTRGLRGPIVYPDEAGYIGWARLFAGQGGDGGLHYFPAYGLLLAPLAAMFPNITSLYPAILIFNGLLCSFLPVGLYRLSGLLAENKKIRILGTVAAGLYPTYVMYANLALCENLLCVGFVYLILAVCKMTEKGGFGWVLFWLVALPLTHSRAFALLPAVGIVIFLQTKGKKRWLLLGAAAAVFLGGAGYLLLDRHSVNTAHLREQVHLLFTPNGFFSLVTVWISQQLYLIMSTFGFYLIGAWYGIKLVVKKEKGWQTVLFILLAVLFTGALSALYLSHHERPVHLFYGRYNDYVMSAMLLLGSVGIGWKTKKPPVWLGGIWILFTVSSWWFYRTSLAKIGGSIINALGIFLYRLVLREFDVLLASVFFMAVAALIFMLGRKRREISLMALCGVYLLTAVLIDITHFEADQRYGQPDHIAVARAMEPNAEIRIGPNPLLWIYNASRVYAPDMKLRTQDMGQNFLLSDEWQPDLPLLSSERRMNMYLYAANEETARWYGQNGMLLSQQSTFSGTVSLLSVGEETVRLALRNTGDPWLCLSSIRDTARAVRIGVRVLDENGQVTQVLRYDLPCNVTKGQTVEVELPLYPIMYIELVRDFSDVEFTGGALMLRDGREEFCQRLPDLGEIWFCMLHQFEETGSAVNQLEGFYHQYAGPNAVIKHIHLDTQHASRLRIETEQPAQFRLWADGQELQLLDQSGNYCGFALTGQTEITELKLESVCYNPFQQSGLPQWLSFISVDSRIVPAAWLAREVPEWNNHDYGPAIRRIIPVR